MIAVSQTAHARSEVAPAFASEPVTADHPGEAIARVKRVDRAHKAAVMFIGNR